jgi:hypothetical protein
VVSNIQSCEKWSVKPLVAPAHPALRLGTPATPAGPTCWLLFGYVFYSEPVLRIPLALYHLYIISPAGRRAIGTSRWPWLLRSSPLHWGMARYFTGSRIIKTAALDPSRRYVFAGHPHGLLGNAFFLAFCTDLLGFSRLFPGIRLSIGGTPTLPPRLGMLSTPAPAGTRGRRVHRLFQPPSHAARLPPPAAPPPPQGCWT